METNADQLEMYLERITCHINLDLLYNFDKEAIVKRIPLYKVLLEEFLNLLNQSRITDGEKSLIMFKLNIVKGDLNCYLLNMFKLSLS